jgi:hypothetical protein
MLCVCVYGPHGLIDPRKHGPLGRILRSMSDVEKLRIPRFRIVLEASFPDANPRDPSGYEDLIAKWKESLENNTAYPCKDIKLREYQTIGAVDDYTDWRCQRGEYKTSAWPGEGLGVVRGRQKTDTGRK